MYHMALIPDDMLYYYNTTEGKTHYFSATYKIRTNTMQIVEVSEDEFWGTIAGDLIMEEVSPAAFPYKLPATISGTVKVFAIK